MHGLSILTVTKNDSKRTQRVYVRKLFVKQLLIKKFRKKKRLLLLATKLIKKIREE